MGVGQIMHRVQEFIDQRLRNQAEPEFASRDALLVAKVLCRTRFSHDTCTPNQTPYSNGILTLFQKALPKWENIPDRLSGGDWLVFDREGLNYKLQCKDHICYTH